MHTQYFHLRGFPNKSSNMNRPLPRRVSAGTLGDTKAPLVGATVGGVGAAAQLVLVLGAGFRRTVPAAVL